MTNVPRLKKTEWPVHITDALGIPSIQGRAGPWHSTGDTTDLAWFRAMCDHLRIMYAGERIRAMRRLIEAAGGTWDQARHSSALPGKQAGGNVRREAFEDLWLALHTGGFLTSDSKPTGVADHLAQSGGGPRPDTMWTYQQIRLRQGQTVFRNRLLAAYGKRCAVTGTDVTETLEAAHIVPHAGGGGMETTNGLLLRADLHTLFDLRLLAVDTATWTVVVNSRIRGLDSGKDLHGRHFMLPPKSEDRPSTAALDHHRHKCGL